MDYTESLSVIPLIDYFQQFIKEFIYIASRKKTYNYTKCTRLRFHKKHFNVPHKKNIVNEYYLKNPLTLHWKEQKIQFKNTQHTFNFLTLKLVEVWQKCDGGETEVCDLSDCHCILS